MRMKGRDLRPKLAAILDFYRYGDMMVIRGKVNFAEANLSSDANLNTCKKWNASIKIRPLVILSRDVRSLNSYTTAYIAKLMRESIENVERRNPWLNLADYLYNEVTLVSCKGRSKLSTDENFTANDEKDQVDVDNNKLKSLINCPFAQARLSLPILEYRHNERNRLLLLFI